MPQRKAVNAFFRPVLTGWFDAGGRKRPIGRPKRIDNSDNLAIVRCVLETQARTGKKWGAYKLAAKTLNCDLARVKRVMAAFLSFPDALQRMIVAGRDRVPRMQEFKDATYATAIFKFRGEQTEAARIFHLTVTENEGEN